MNYTMIISNCLNFSKDSSPNTIITFHRNFRMSYPSKYWPEKHDWYFKWKMNWCLNDKWYYSTFFKGSFSDFFWKVMIAIGLSVALSWFYSICLNKQSRHLCLHQYLTVLRIYVFRILTHSSTSIGVTFRFFIYGILKLSGYAQSQQMRT